MSEENEDVARRFQEAFAAGDRASLEEIVAEDVVDHTPRPGQPPGRQPLLDAVAGFAAGFPDLEITVEQVVAEGDLVVQYGVMTGTNAGEWMGMPATNRPVSVAFMDMHRVVGGTVTESWHLEDIAGMLQQLGVAGD